MGRVMARWLPATLFGRLALLLGVAVVVSHVMALTLMFRLLPGPHGELGHPGPPPPHLSGDAPALPSGSDRPVGPDGPGGQHWQRMPPPPPDDQTGGPAGGLPDVWAYPGLLVDVGVRLAALLVVAWFGARWLSQPLQQLAKAARDLGEHIDRPPLPEVGTTECREATRVFNQMQQRIRQHIAERERFLAAVSHDLRTPLTRIRLRAESVEAATLREGFQRDVTEMQTLIEATLGYLGGQQANEQPTLVDVADLLHSLADDQLDAGHDVQVHAQAEPFLGQPIALRRCVDNLVSNAIRYGGGQVTLRCHDDGAQLVIEVQDNGPGLPVAELSRVTEPFYRVEASRHKARGGVGLGLSIALDVARRHRGTLTLSNVPTGGLLATLSLPRRLLDV